jgi:hypothetical protein
LALLTLEIDWHSERTPIDAALTQRARQELLASVNSSPEQSSQYNVSLTGATLLALALLERRQESPSWDWLPEELQANSFGKPRGHEIWCTVIAILYGLAEDRNQLLKALVGPGRPAAMISLALHALLSNPTPAGELEKCLTGLLNGLTFPEDARLVNLLTAEQPSMAARLGRRLVKDLPDLSPVRLTPDIDEQVDLISRLIWAAELHTTASQPAQAAALHSMAIDILRHLQAKLANSACESVFLASGPSAAAEAWQLPDWTVGTLPSASLLCHYLDEGRLELARER